MPRRILYLRNVEIGGRGGLDVRIVGGAIAEVGPRLAGRGEELDGRGGALIPGLHDHHIHILATAARARSLDLAALPDREAAEAAIRRRASALPAGEWLRVTGYHETPFGPLSLADLDRLSPVAPLRIEHQSGAVWLLNSAALAALGSADLTLPLERDAAGGPTGRIWRGDAWLGRQIADPFPGLARLGAALAAYGLSGLTDASVTTDASALAHLSASQLCGDLPQNLLIMSGRDLTAPTDAAIAIGPLKILLDDHALPDLQATIGAVRAVHEEGRAVAAHCVTEIQLAFMLAVLGETGAVNGDRIEHGSMIGAAAIGELKRLALTVITQPGFIDERGERYLADIPPQSLGDLYRCASLIKNGVKVAAGSDAPYTSVDPWRAMRAATSRKTRGGTVLGPEERLPANDALALYLGHADDPGGEARRVAVGAPADLCLLEAPIHDVLANLDAGMVRATIIRGRIVYGR